VGTFPRVLGHYSRDLKLFPLEDAVRRMTSYSAQRFKLTKRGEVKPGFYADICVFDPATVIDTATFDKRSRRRAASTRCCATARSPGATASPAAAAQAARSSFRTCRRKRKLSWGAPLQWRDLLAAGKDARLESRAPSKSVGAFVAARALETLVAFLRLDRERGDRTGF